MEPFVYDSEEFQAELAESAHARGEVAFLESMAKPGTNALDVGANRGVSTVALARKVGAAGHVYAFEPVPEYHAVLTDTLRRNQAENVSTFQLALGERRGRIPFYKHGGGSGIAPADDAEQIQVPVTTVSRFLIEHRPLSIDLISMDCEGSELDVLRGAGELLRNGGPDIFCEVHHGALEGLGQTVRMLAAFLEDLGYAIQPIAIEEAGQEVNLDECTHLRASKTARGPLLPRQHSHTGSPAKGHAGESTGGGDG